MNYFSKIQKIEKLLGPEMEKRYPHVWSLLFDYAEKLVMAEDAGRTLDSPNAFRADFYGTRSLLGYKFLLKTLAYLFCRQVPVKKMQRPSLLLSYNLEQRFSKLARRLAAREQCLVLATRTNIKFARKSPGAGLLKCDGIFYTRPIENLLKTLTPLIGATSDWNTHAGILQDLETRLNKATDQLATLFREWQITQYITPFAGRFEEILICLACKKAGVISKEICHGVNSHKLENSDNVVPTFTDRFYVWNQQYLENISGFKDMGRVKICGYPKFSKEEINVFYQTSPPRRLITFFSQPAYDLGQRVNEPLTSEFLNEEKIWRDELLLVLSALKNNHGFEIRIRYHRGEVKSNLGCDRSQEKLRVKQLGFEISTHPLEQDLCESQVCIGINTSVLYEAFVLGRHVLQVQFSRTGESNYHNTIPVLPCAKLMEKILSLNEEKPQIKTALLMDLDWFLAQS